MLDVLAEVGIVAPAYRDHSVRRGQTLVRLPWVKKQPEEYSYGYESDGGWL